MQFFKPAVTATLLAAFPAMGAQVSWSPAFEVASDADLHLAGRQVVYAVNGGNNVGSVSAYPSGSTLPTTASSVTVGERSISFEGVAVHYGTGSLFNAPTYGDVKSHLVGQSHNVTFSAVGGNTAGSPLFASWDPLLNAGARTVYNTPTGNSALDSILESQLWMDGRTVGSSQLNIVLNNLTAGTEYDVQIIAAGDSRTHANADRQRHNRFTIDDGQGNIATGLNAYSDLNGDSISHVTSVIGTFTAGEDGTQALNLGLAFGRQPGISAIIVTSVPEPTSIAVLGLGAAALLRRRRNAALIQR